MKFIGPFCLFYILIHAVTGTENHNDKRKRRRTKRKTKKSKNVEKPIIYTFFEVKELPNFRQHDKTVHEEILAVWTKLWKEAGWEPKILTLDDAKKHPDFTKYDENLVMDSSIERTFHNLYRNSYNYMCFMRWLAMAAHGKGGWMSDYDTFPIGSIANYDGLKLPNNGAFTGHERHVPSLLSGTAEEWDRMAKIILEEGVKKVKQEKVFTYSDMFTLRNIIKRDKDAFIEDMQVYMGFPYKEKNVVDCEAVDRHLVTHLSHCKTEYAVEHNLVEIPDKKYSERVRPRLAEELYNNWRVQCSTTAS